MKNKSFVLNSKDQKHKEKMSNFFNFFNIAYKDYIAARILFNSNQLYRAVILANTCIEKYFKVFLSISGNSSHTHDVSKLFKSIRNFDRNLANDLNEEFIELLSLAYNMRYFDNQIFSSRVKEFNLCVSRNKTLAELDNTVNKIETAWEIQKNGQVLKTRYKYDVENKNVHLYENNFILNNISKKDFIERRDHIYEIRNSKSMGIIEVEYETEDSKDDGKFLNEALRPGTT